jgi:hypothetical protein
MVIILKQEMTVLLPKDAGAEKSIKIIAKSKHDA